MPGSVTDLAVHVTGASRGQAAGLRRAASGSQDVAALDPLAQRDPRALLAALKEGQDGLLSALRELPPQAVDGFVPLPFGLVPAAVALQIVPLEYGFHRNDLDWALGDPAALSQDMAAALLGLAPGLLPMLAAGSPVSPPGAQPAGPTSFWLSSPGAGLLARYDEAGWSITPADGPPASGAPGHPVTCEISGDDSSLALFIMGRIDSDHPALTVTDLATARRFKQYFPGP